MKFRLIEEKENKKTLDLDEALGLKEDTIKQNGKWVNKGKEGTHGTFRTKKEADAQRKAMFAQGFEEDLEECIYLFPELTEEDKEELHNYDLAYLGKNHFEGEISDVVKGNKEDLIRYGKEYLDYILHPDYLYKEEDFAGEIVNEKLERNEISDFFDKAKRLGVENLGQLKDLLAQEESKGNTEKEKIDAYSDSVELGKDTLSNESLKEDLNKESLEQEIRKSIREHFKTWDDEDYEDMIGEYLVVEVEDQEDGRTKVEVRAELTYGTMDKIADELNKIVQKYDKDAYFDHEDAGIINAFIDKNAEGKAIDEYDASKDEKLQGVRLRDYRNKWSAIDHMEVNGVDYYMFENDTYGDETYYVVTPNINDGPFYETFDDIETCLRDEGVLEESLKEEKKLDEIFVDTYLTKEHLSYVLHNVLDWERGYSPENRSDVWEVAHACHIYDDDYSDSEYAEAIELYDAFDEDGNVTSRIDEKLIQGKSDATLKKNIATEIKAGKDPKQAYAIAKSIQKKNESFEDEHLGKEQIIDDVETNVKDYEVIEDNISDNFVENFSKLALQEAKKLDTQISTQLNENIHPEDEAIKSLSEGLDEEAVIDYVNPNEVSADFKPQQVDLSKI